MNYLAMELSCLCGSCSNKKEILFKAEAVFKSSICMASKNTTKRNSNLVTEVSSMKAEVVFSPRYLNIHLKSNMFLKHLLTIIFHSKSVIHYLSLLSNPFIYLCLNNIFCCPQYLIDCLCLVSVQTTNSLLRI